ncbi:metal-dependent hydrolase [Candidatus Pacearchaeota archaeon]|nr:metal-dependent hydrolase [Candidatus Pacearchaeota archaeon]
MILAHLLIGIILGKLYGNYLLFILGSILPDIDHIFIIVKNKIYTLEKIIDSIRYEKEYNLNYKTALFHSLFGLVIFSLMVYIFVGNKAIYFSAAYLLHLLIDWPDTDTKYFLYPLKTKFKGFLPIWSKPEQILTIILILTIAILFLLN